MAILGMLLNKAFLMHLRSGKSGSCRCRYPTVFHTVGALLPRHPLCERYLYASKMIFKNREIGFTLIEVLIALAIISIAITAIIKSTSQNIKYTTYVENKTIATWVATDIMNQIHLGLITLPQASEKITNATDMLGRKWEWQAYAQTTPNPHIQEIHVEIISQPTQLTGYLYVPENK